MPSPTGYGKSVVLSARFGELTRRPYSVADRSVVWQLRFEDHPALAAPQTVLRFQELLGGPEGFSLRFSSPRSSSSCRPVAASRR